MKGQRRGCLTKEDLSPHDLQEVERFETFLRRVSELRKTGTPRAKAQIQAHSEVYGEVIFPKDAQ